MIAIDTSMLKNNGMPPSGSPEAVAMGCTCPVMDNGHGKGWLGNGEQFGWMVAEVCPLHGQAQEGEKDD